EEREQHGDGERRRTDVARPGHPAEHAQQNEVPDEICSGPHSDDEGGGPRGDADDVHEVEGEISVEDITAEILQLEEREPAKHLTPTESGEGGTDATALTAPVE